MNTRTLFAMAHSVSWKAAGTLGLLAVLFLPSACLSQSAQPKELPDSPKPHDLQKHSDYRPITGGERVKWVLVSTFGPSSLMNGGVSAAWDTAFNSPEEYGPHWDGFAKRYGMRFTAVASSHAMEAGLGAMWGEDPRYIREPERSFGARVRHVIAMTFTAAHRDAQLRPAYARFLAVPGSNFLSNTWRVSSDATSPRALRRTATGFLDRMATNAFHEFWPDVRRAVFHR